MNKYRLYYYADDDDANWKKCQAAELVSLGDVLQLACGFYHVVCAITQQKTGVRLDLSKSAQNPEGAILLAKQRGEYPKGDHSHVVNPHPKIHSRDALSEL